MPTVKKRIKTLINSLLREKVKIGDAYYWRRRFLPNPTLSKKKHEEYLNDIFSIALKLKEGDVIDVGANNGQTLVKMLATDKNRSYWGFEPQAALSSCIEIFLSENGLRNAHILTIALSDKTGVLSLNLRGRGYASLISSVSSMIEGFRPESFYSGQKYIYAVRGDDVIARLGIQAVSLVKIDVEGAEPEVLRGLEQTIEKTRPFLLFEVLNHYLALTGETLDKSTIEFRMARIQEMENFIQSARYHIYSINKKNELLKVDRITPGLGDSLSSTDYIAVPHESERALLSLLEKERKQARN